MGFHFLSSPPPQPPLHHMFGTSSDWIFRAKWNLKRNSWVQSIHLEVNSPADGGKPLCGLFLDFHSLLPLESWPWGTLSHVKLFFLLIGAELGSRLAFPHPPSFLPLTCQVALLAAPPPGDSELTGPLKQETWHREVKGSKQALLVSEVTFSSPASTSCILNSSLCGCQRAAHHC